MCNTCLLIALSLLIPALCDSTIDRNIDPIDCLPHADGSLYKEEFLIHGVRSPSDLIVNWQTNILYFRYYNMQRRKRVSATLDLQNGDYNIIDLSGDCVHAVDQKRGKVYAGCWSSSGLGGLFKYDSINGHYVPIGEQGEDIEYIYYSDVLYYTKYPTWLLQTYARGQAHPVSELGDGQLLGLAVDSDGDKIFYNYSGLYQQKSGSREIVQYVATDEVRAVAADANGKVYACGFINEKNAIFHVNKSSTLLNNVVKARDCYGIAFDKDNNMIYADWINRQIIRFAKC